MKISEIDTHLRSLSNEKLQLELDRFAQDERAGVQKLCDKYRKQIQKAQKEVLEWDLKVAFDEAFRHDETVLVGIDEVGRGPLAGPVVAAAVVLPSECFIPGLKDSKKLSEEKREELYDVIKAQALGIGIGLIEPDEIDQINILQATFKAMKEAVGMLGQSYDMILVDGDKTIPGIECVQHAVIKGDDKSAAIAAASVIAKVTRDRLMREYHEIYPMYDWLSNKGYGSEKHYEAIRTYGITTQHRKSFLKKEGY
ncbi:MAG: ribonuclease HII [Cellulosilyticaceae bacterium]